MSMPKRCHEIMRLTPALPANRVTRSALHHQSRPSAALRTPEQLEHESPSSNHCGNPVSVHTQCLLIAQGAGHDTAPLANARLNHFSLRLLKSQPPPAATNQHRAPRAQRNLSYVTRGRHVAKKKRHVAASGWPVTISRAGSEFGPQTEA